MVKRVTVIETRVCLDCKGTGVAENDRACGTCNGSGSTTERTLR